ncbi:PAS domain-containing protein [Blastococcus sp. TML/M2B]|uniref:PAS domain-containing protein n=1 Tax=unclassified Blastococcus TaxID=2619396 RepID=UPI00190AF08F|nr:MULTISPECIES: PAS domain-containing protein [unclassified Blastococcus]MBN1094220.1 PAS domain-containing protein [Blastococcus sp. TML/M2B]MBN1095659.1 PAS domain-containing protein [Blastococcus sp. TML/C7B]
MLDTQAAPDGTRGARRRVLPTGVERAFAEDDLIVSKTDRRGVITYANDVFLRVSGYPLDQVLGQPHNLIRHPEMPRAVFALLWEDIAAGREVFAYINNLAADGGHYWVLAHVTPSYDDRGRIVGYHSNRRRPSPSAVARVVPLYRHLLDEEQRHPTARAAVEASSRLLEQLVAAEADSYEDFVWSIINREES